MFQADLPPQETLNPPAHVSKVDETRLTQANYSSGDAPPLRSLPTPTFDADADGADQVPEEQIKNALNHVRESLEIVCRADPNVDKAFRSASQPSIVVTTSVPETCKRVSGQETISSRTKGLTLICRPPARHAPVVLLDFNSLSPTRETNSAESLMIVSHEAFHVAQPDGDHVWREIDASLKTTTLLLELSESERDPEFKAELHEEYVKERRRFKRISRANASRLSVRIEELKRELLKAVSHAE